MKIRRLDLDDQSINQEHEALGIPPVEYDVTHASDHPLLRIASYLVFAILSGLLLYLAYRLFLGGNIRSGTEIITDAIHDLCFGALY